MMRVLWLSRAETDLNELFDFLLERDVSAANRVAGAIQGSVKLLAGQPGLGRPGRVAGTRELVIPHTPYIVAYTVDPALDIVIVLRVLHGARRWPTEL